MYDILNILFTEQYVNRSVLAKKSGYSLSLVNRVLKNLIQLGYLDKTISLTEKAVNEYKKKVPKKAIILAAGYGMRMVPINTEIPKGLLEVNGEPLIERIIKQLHEVEISEIYIVVGFLKEKYEYLIDKYDVELVINSTYSTKNNLHSMKLITDKLKNAYIIPCDIWCNNNPFSKHELYSWYMVSNFVDNDSEVRVNRKMELVRIPKCSGGNKMIGLCYLSEEDGEKIATRIKELSQNPIYNDAFWEESLYEKNHMIIVAKVVDFKNVLEINTYEELRELDSESNQLKTDAIHVICNVFNVSAKNITNITVLKKGMTNRSFLFSIKNKKYIMRIPGEGTEQLINRKQEEEVYKAINKKNICDDVIYINRNNGYKISEFLENARVCNPKSEKDIKECMTMLRKFHELDLKVEHEFDIFKQIEFYESLWKGTPSIYKDYLEIKKKIFSLKLFIDSHIEKKVLTHIDAVPDNFLFLKKKGKEEIRLIDWEYAAMQDPHLDIAMFCIYSLYNKKQVDHLIDLYFIEGCTFETKVKIYCYIAVCGLLWSNWCEYKRNLGVEFGEYSLRQYRYAKDYYKIVQEVLKNASR